MCDGDARVGLGALELALEARGPVDLLASGPDVLSVDDIKDGIKVQHCIHIMFYLLKNSQELIYLCFLLCDRYIHMRFVSLFKRARNFVCVARVQYVLPLDFFLKYI